MSGDTVTQGWFEAGIFDMDGVLLDSEPLHFQAVNEVLAEDGVAAIPFEEYARYLGTTLEYTWRDLIERHALQRPFLHYRDRYDALILDHYRRSSEIAPGARRLLRRLRDKGLRLAVASSSRTEWVETCLIALGLHEAFDAVVTGDMVKQSKPDPEIYLAAASLVQARANRCLAFEDAPKGIAAARAAGMFTVAVETPYTKHEDTSAANIQLSSLAEFDLSLLTEAPRSLTR